jgi:LemA protein
MKKHHILLAVLVFVLLVPGTFIFMYNKLVSAEKKVEEAKAQIDVASQRRLDLIPNLVEVVKGYAKHEKETLTAVTEARGKAQKVLLSMAGAKSISKEQMKEFAASEKELKGSLMSLFALAEKYPNLKAHTSYLTLQDQLEGTENRISVARLRYNNAVRLFNTKTVKFPSSIVASTFNFETKDYFEATEGAEKVMKVEL